ncbi:MAG: asparagine synthase C-terminal domain-containing protein [Candidatus Limnocylindrales bacterium]
MDQPRVADGSLAALLDAAIAARPCEAILLSGGLDTSIVAELAVARGTRLAVTVITGDEAPDLPYASELARRLRLEHVVLRRSLPELASALPDLIRTLGTFDGMFLRNDVVVAEGVREIARRGLHSCWTGDGADELFAGYSFVFQKPPREIERTIAHLADTMAFNGPRIGAAVGIQVRSPYLDPAVIDFARSLSGEELVLDHGGERLGKAPLRRAFADRLGDRHAYRRKDPIEIGSGATALKTFMSARVTDFPGEAARILREDGVRIRDAERVAYYRIYREVLGPPAGDLAMPKECPDCHARGPEGTYCRVCGAYPI